MPPPLEALGLLVRGTRAKKGWTQQHAARIAGVSRKQWALLEKGENASAVFLRKVAAALDLHEIPLGNDLEARTGTDGGLDLIALLHLTDELSSLVQRIQAFAIEAALPPSERGQRSSAIAAFVAGRSDLSAEDSTRLGRAIERLTTDIAPDTSDVRPSPKRIASRGKRRF